MDHVVAITQHPMNVHQLQPHLSSGGSTWAAQPLNLQSGAKILETWYFMPPSPLKQCCNNHSMPPGLLKWSTQHCLWEEGGNSQ